MTTPLPVCVCVFLFACITCSIPSFAGNKPVNPLKFTTNFKATVKVLDSLTADRSTTKVCACQILNMWSPNYKLENVAVFAERTNKDASADFALAMRQLEKEKRYLRIAFFDRINVVAQTKAATDCSTLFKQLKKKHEQLTTYEVLNADILVR